MSSWSEMSFPAIKTTSFVTLPGGEQIKSFGHGGAEAAPQETFPPEGLKWDSEPRFKLAPAFVFAPDPFSRSICEPPDRYKMATTQTFQIIYGVPLGNHAGLRIADDSIWSVTFDDMLQHVE